MKFVLVFLILAVVSNEALARSFRQKRQSNQSQTTGQTNNPNSTPQGQVANVPAVPNQDRDIQACIRSCPVTSEYNPVCGTNGVTYENPSRLFCAQTCGITVNLLRSSRCPPAPRPNS